MLNLLAQPVSLGLVPFGAILAGRQTLAVGEMGWWRIALALALFALVFYGHRWAFGVSPIPA